MRGAGGNAVGEPSDRPAFHVPCMLQAGWAGRAHLGCVFAQRRTRLFNRPVSALALRSEAGDCASRGAHASSLLRSRGELLRAWGVHLDTGTGV